MFEAQAVVNKGEMIQSYPEHVRKLVVDVLKTGHVSKESLNKEYILFYLEYGSMSSPLKNACEDKLLDGINYQNSVDALQIAEKYDLLRLEKEATEMITKRFADVWECDAFKHLDEKMLEKLCSTYSIARNKYIYQALEWWLEFSHEIRFHVYCKLLQVVQLQRAQSKCHKMKRKFTSYHAMLMSSTTKSKNNIVTAVFNSDGDMVCHRKLFKSNELKENFCFACVQNDETEAPYIYLASGKHVQRYDPLLNKHENCANFVHSRTGCSLVALNGSLYAIGGQNHSVNVSAIEVLDAGYNDHKSKFSKKPSWKVVDQIPNYFKLDSAPCVTYNDNIYIIGQSISEGVPSTVVLVFNPDEKSVTSLAEFPQKCSDSKAVIHDSDIYISSKEGHFLKFDLKTNLFTSCADLPIRSQNTAMYVEEKNIYAFVFVNQEANRCRQEMIKYDIQTQSWTKVKEIPCNMPVSGCCDIKVPSYYENIIPFYETKFQEIKL